MGIWGLTYGGPCISYNFIAGQSYFYENHCFEEIFSLRYVTRTAFLLQIINLPMQDFLRSPRLKILNKISLRELTEHVLLFCKIPCHISKIGSVLSGFNVGLKSNASGLLTMVWDSSRRMIRRHAIAIVIRHGGEIGRGFLADYYS